jgi:hypothetical protein
MCFHVFEVLKNTENLGNMHNEKYFGKKCKGFPLSHTKNPEFKRKTNEQMGPVCVFTSMPSCDGPKISFLHISKI